MLCGMRQISVTECLSLRRTSRHREHLAGHRVTQGEGRLAKAGKKPMRVVCVGVCISVVCLLLSSPVCLNAPSFVWAFEARQLCGLQLALRPQGPN